MNLFRTEILLTAPIEQVFEFFSDARNLQEITPEWLNFEVVTQPPIPMKCGAIIDYRLRVHGFPVRWRTEITAWEPPFRFVDEQRRGPYKAWIHEHRFASVKGGTLASDVVRYLVPGGRLVDWLFVRRDVVRIFDYRKQKLAARFGEESRLDSAG